MGNEKISSGRGDRLNAAVAFALLAALVVISHGGALKADFVYDDHNQLVGNPSIRSLKNVPRFFTHPAETIGEIDFEGIYRPLRTTYFALGYRLWGPNPAAFHAANLLFHLLNSFLVFLFLRRMCGAERSALAAALLFAAHPAMTDVVCWICSSSDVLCMFFYLTALLCWFRTREETGGRRRAFYAISLVSLVLALLSKEMAITFPAVIVAIDFWRDGLKGLTPKRWPSYLPFIIVAGIYFAIRMNIMSRFSQRGYWGDTPLASAAIIIKAVAFYVGLLVYPFRLTIFPTIDTNVSATDPAVVLAVLLIALMIAAALWLRRKSPALSLGIVLFFIMLAPVSGIIPLTTIVAGRFVYIPSVGIFLAATALFGGLGATGEERSRKRGPAMAAAIAAVVFLFSFNTILRSLDWRSDLALFKSATEVDPDNPRARTSLGKEYFILGDPGASRREALAAIELSEDHAEAHSLLGRILVEEGRTSEAEREFKIVIDAVPNDNYANNALGTMYRNQGRLEDALARFEAASNRQPITWRTLNNAGSALLELGKPTEALEYFGRALGVMPDAREAAYNKGAALVGLGRNAEAASFLAAWMSENSHDASLLTMLGFAHSAEQNFEAAIEAYRHALSMNPKDIAAASYLADLHMRRGEYEDAIPLYETIVDARPDSARERILYATALEGTGRVEEALEQLKEAAKLEPDDASIQEMLAQANMRLENRSGARP